MRKAMIVWGGWPGHDPDLCASMMRGWLKAEGFEVRIETTTAAFADPAIHDLSLIIPIYTMSKIEKPEALNRCASGARAASGSPAITAACAMRSAIRCDYQFLCGGQWVAHPGNIIDYKVDLTKPDDPIMQGLEQLRAPLRAVLHACRPGQRGVGDHDLYRRARALDRGRGDAGGVEEALSAQGRVFYSSLGHRAYELDVPEIRTLMTRGMLWAAR